MTVADRIKLLRERLGWTQEQLAEKMGYNGKSSISKIETSGNNITLKKIEKLAPILKTSNAYLMGWVDDPDPDYPISREKLRAAQEGIDKLVGFKTEHYYEDEETSAVAQSLFENEEMRLLFDAAKDSKPEDLKMAADLLLRLKKTGIEE